ncbi:MULTISPECIES: molecular chaperone DjiA [unclassified Iodidimonas]|jgi:DnaJ like chaperone protein|uniref:molecular chaperone DjiA n=1 Tax=unclassified Iodidimonas TaxID=2626145 RepID=UPI0024823E5A|nr:MULTISPECIES: molecular chaperone DjiA [unclassified Iodidimonas]
MSIWDSLFSAASGLLRLITGSENEDDATRKITFTIGVIALSAKMAKADGQVTEDEVDAFRAIFDVPPHELKNVARVYDMARQDTAGFEVYARQVAALFKDRAIVLEDLLDALFHIARADGSVHRAEIDFLHKVAGIFGFSDAEFEALSARHIGADRNSPYTILGVSPDIADDDLKAAYHRLIKENHPDRLMAMGLPREFISVANDRLASINAAYDRVKAQRNQ